MVGNVWVVVGRDLVVGNHKNQVPNPTGLANSEIPVQIEFCKVYWSQRVKPPLPVKA